MEYKSILGLLLIVAIVVMLGQELYQKYRKNKK